MLVPSVASASVVALGLGPFDTPFQPAVVTTFVRHNFAPQSPPPGLATIESVRRGAPYLMAAQTSAVAAPYIYATGQEVLPLGGFTGTQPSPTSATVRTLVAKSRFHLALVRPPSASASAAFVTAHCLRVPPRPGAAGVPSGSEDQDLLLHPVTGRFPRPGIQKSSPSGFAQDTRSSAVSECLASYPKGATIRRGCGCVMSGVWLSPSGGKTAHNRSANTKIISQHGQHVALHVLRSKRAVREFLDGLDTDLVEAGG